MNATNRWGFDGYLIDAEFKGDDAAFVAFLNVVGTALHAQGLYLGVFLYPDMDKAKCVSINFKLLRWEHLPKLLRGFAITPIALPNLL